MPRPEKVQAVEDIRSRIESAQATFLTEYRGLNVSQQQQLRRSLRSSGTEYKIVKMTLARLAAGELGIEGAEEWLTGPTALAFAGGDPVETAKALRDFAREHEQLVVKAGFLGGRLLLPEQVSRLADVEPRPVLLAKVAGAFQAPLAQAAGLFAALTRNTASVVSQLLEKRAASQTEDGSRKSEEETADQAETAEGGRETAAEEVAEVVEEAEAVVAEPEAAAEPEPGVAAEPEPEATAEVAEEPEAEAEPVAAAEEDTNNETPAEPAEEE
jgi:large subunit ribosomal protein L10